MDATELPHVLLQATQVQANAMHSDKDQQVRLRQWILGDERLRAATGCTRNHIFKISLRFSWNAPGSQKPETSKINILLDIHAKSMEKW